VHGKFSSEFISSFSNILQVVQQFADSEEALGYIRDMGGMIG